MASLLGMSLRFESGDVQTPTRMTRSVLLVLCTLCVVPATAHAYVDPGSGSMMLQLLLASFLGGLYALKTYWRRIRAWFTGKREDLPKAGDPDQNPPHE